MNDEKNKQNMSRRNFLGTTALTAAATVTILPSHVLGGKGRKAPSDRLNIACVGAGGKGKSDIRGVFDENIVALCDVDDTKIAELPGHLEDLPGSGDWFTRVKKFKDFRVMLDKMHKDIDAVTVTTPDHTHAVIALTAMNMGKHVYVQKPLTHTIREARALADTARKMKVTTQMGNQGHASEGARLINEWIWDGAIGEVSEVHCWTNRPIWPQGIDAPAEIPSVPPSLDWNLWLGPMKWRPYHPALCHFVWRGWRDFGTGALGDMGAHIINHPYWALDLKYPETVQASSTRFTDASWPVASKVIYQFPARGNKPPVKLTWYDGGLMPERPELLEQSRRLGESDGGMLFVGTKGYLMSGCYASNPRLIPETAMQAYKRPEKTIPRSPGIYEEWIEAAKKGEHSTTDFSYSGPLTETMLLGNVAILLQDQNMIYHWDGEKGEITNHDAANGLLHIPYREGWTL
ncbi:Gfo/Idh/MocA family oxidoreductase [bacterium]|nr:Gfo/Idh/MocA family oxidoreductase [bacterium]